MLERMAPLQSGRDTEIDMIEREMEGGVVVEQPPWIYEYSDGKRWDAPDSEDGDNE